MIRYGLLSIHIIYADISTFIQCEINIILFANLRGAITHIDLHVYTTVNYLYSVEPASCTNLAS
jgi:hypothetical protein